jgi:hypothetical protein
VFAVHEHHRRSADHIRRAQNLIGQQRRDQQNLFAVGNQNITDEIGCKNAPDMDIVPSCRSADCNGVQRFN